MANGTAWVWVAAAWLAIGSGAAAAQAEVTPSTPPKAVVITPEEVAWGPGPPNLPPGAQVAVVEGDPSAPGQPFALRLRMPDGYQIAPHVHPVDAHVTVLDGTYELGFGDERNPANMRALKPGGYAVEPAGTSHYGTAHGNTVIQVHGTGPWGLEYVDPADDPQRAGVGGAGTPPTGGEEPTDEPGGEP